MFSAASTTACRRAVATATAQNSKSHVASATFAPQGRNIHSTSSPHNTVTKKDKDVISGDKRYQLIKEMLYSKETPSTPAKPLGTQPLDPRSSPVSTESPQAQRIDTIERAWTLEKQKEAVAKVAELRGMYESMREAMEELEKTDTRLFEAAKSGSDREKVVVFPKRLRVPTETPPLDGWDYEMKAATR
ncbi:uncharacterized protein EV422DRAFT_521554 [Fimicolochytrium jonesii]|uniref:uncharacterized protein n=1 Tax=Fimicolochytrium jonesii TaxID=1396493 RepID=UPI0022FF2C9B|nr:uncharacterized protein EV422DRAFT_521554 [Fimicolochytrium jonesii]KAI8823581.1 hypothetical protein EV422DRAFT_521554 [Fimicolochytrium jonesii]